MGIKRACLLATGVLCSMFVSNSALAFEVKVMIQTEAKVAACDGERACETALSAAKSKARSAARQEAPDACKTQEGTFNAKSSKVLYVTMSDANGPGLFDRSTRIWKYNWDVTCMLYMS